MRGVRRPHNPRIQHDGIQEERSDEENEHSLMKYMHHDSEEKPEKPERRSGQGRPPKQKALPDHWLQLASLQRVNSMLATMENVSKQMVVELEAAERSPVVGPAMLTICKAVKRRRVRAQVARHLVEAAAALAAHLEPREQSRI